MSDQFNNDAERQLGKFLSEQAIDKLQKTVLPYRERRIFPEVSISCPGKLLPITEDVPHVNIRHGYYRIVKVPRNYGIYRVGDFIEVEATEVVEAEEEA